MMADKTLAILMLLMISYTLNPGSCFLFDPTDQCLLVDPPCICSDHFVQCENKQLDEVPKFRTVDMHSDTLNILLGNNNITSIEKDSFFNISSINASQIEINLKNNYINKIYTDAFNGIADEITVINLENNNLQSIPESLTDLRSLEALNVLLNPIKILSPSTLASLGHTLQTFSISLDKFNSWPTELRFLRILKNLTIDRIMLSRLDDNAFHGLETTLHTLSLTQTSLIRIPSAVCRLQKLEALNFADNLNLQSPFLESCTLPSVLLLNLKNTNLNSFPKVFDEFPSLNSLILSHNNITFIDEGDMSQLYDSNLTMLDLSYNVLHRVPYAINLFNDLKYLDLSGNSIISINYQDLNSGGLLTLDLGQNPIEYIATKALLHSNQLSYLSLSNTNLENIPDAVTKMRGLTHLDFSGNIVECICSLDYLKSWSMYNIQIDGQCEYSNESLKDFLVNSLPQCP